MPRLRLLWVSNLTGRKILKILKVALIVISKGYAPSYEVKIVFSTVWKNFFCFLFLSEYMKTPRTLLFWKKNIRYFNKYFPSAIWLSFSAKFVLEHKMRSSAFKKCQIKPFLAFPLVWISNLTTRKALEMLKFAKIKILKGSGASYEVKKRLFRQSLTNYIDANLENLVK